MTSIKSAIGAAAGVSLLTNISSEKNKQWQRELLMERIRSHSSQHKTYPELSKSMRMGMLEKRYPLDAVEKSNLQKCLDNMQHCIKVTSRQGLVERLESLSRQLSLKFSDDTKALFISTDMFYLEILLDANGSLTDVKVHHESKVEQQSCSELVDCLNRGDFADFTAQLEGFSSIYQLNAESKVKIKAYDAMQAMETDLYNLFQMQNFTKDTQQMLQESMVGIALKRRGGHPMRLVYFVSPYDLLSLDKESLQPLTLDTFSSNKNIGFSVTVNLEASSANKLQILPTVTSTKDQQTGLDIPVFGPLTQGNSMLLPATYVLRLNKPLPVCYTTLRSMRSMGLCSAVGTTVSSTTDAPTSSTSLESQHRAPAISNIMSLVIQTASGQQLKSSQKGLFVCLPNQTHCYYFTENKLLKASVIQSVPFTEPAQVPKILDFLKKMALFYSLLSSCIRTQSKMNNDIDSTTIAEVNAISFQQISVSLQHPYEESMATVEFDLKSGTPQCSIYSINNNYDMLSMKLTKIVQKCLSIPMTIRSLLMFWDQENEIKLFQRNMLQNSGNSGGSNSNMGGGGGGSGNHIHNNTNNNAGGVGGATNYGNFNMIGSMTDNSGIGGGNIKMECSGMNGQQQQQRNSATTNMSATSAVTSGYLSKYSQQHSLMKQEDFHESPKSQTQYTTSANDIINASNNISLSNAAFLQQQQHTSSLMEATHSLGQQTHQQQQTQIDLKLAADNEIADKYKNMWKEKTPNLKNTVSITPIQTDNPSSSAAVAASSLDVKRTGGIEIIPLTNQATNNSGIAAVASAQNTGGNINPSAMSGSNLSSSSSSSAANITITPINTTTIGGVINSEKLNKESKKVSNVYPSSLSNSNSSPSLSSSSANKRSLDSNDGQKEKKRKKKRDDSPMGPPEKVFSRQNSPAGQSDAAATVASRKFTSPSSSPKGSSGGLLASSVTGSSLSARPSPKHSPVYSSPKHNTASNSPKSPFGTHSPKHGSSGKPSMSTLKSATSASPKSEKSAGSTGSVLSASSSSSSSLGASSMNATAMVRNLSSVGSQSHTSSAASSVTGPNVSAVAVAAAAAAMAALKNKDKSIQLNSAVVSSAAAAAAAAVKSSMGVSSMQQLKSVSSSLNHMTASAVGYPGGMGANAGGMGMPASSNNAMDLNAAMRKGVTAAVSLMTSTPATATICNTVATTQQVLETPVLSHSSSNKLLQSQICQEQPLGNNEMLKQQSCNQQDNSATMNNKSSINSEYMVKSQSQEGLKLTINKTSNKSQSSSTPSSSSASASSKTNSKSFSVTASSNNCNNSKKQHTGLKPGVTSGPASKKSTSLSSASSSNHHTTNINSPKKFKTTKHSFKKSNSSGSLTYKASSASGNEAASGSASKSGGYALAKSNSTNSFSSSDSMRKSHKKSYSACTSPAQHSIFPSSASSSQPASRPDPHADMMKIWQYASPTMAATMEGFMKTLNTKFQIPKLSQRNNANANNSNNTTSAVTTTPTNETLNSMAKSTNAIANSNNIKESSTGTNSKTSSSSISLKPSTLASVPLHALKSASSSAVSSATSSTSTATLSSNSSCHVAEDILLTTLAGK